MAIGSRGRSTANAVVAAIVSALVLYAAFFGAGPLPALGRAFNPSTGAWTMALDATVKNETPRLAPLQKPVKVTFEPDGTSHIVAQTDHDLFVATGYVHARLRLFQMDLLRRQGSGRLSEIVGKAALESDRFELQLGLLRTAQQEWNDLPAGHRARKALVAYAQGVNFRIEQAEADHQLPVMFTLLGYHPKPWTPIDSLIVKGDMTQTLNFTDKPLVMALLQKSFGPDLTAQWFPMLPPNPQSPYDTGPYATQPSVVPIVATQAPPITDQVALAAADVHRRLAALPAGLVASNAGASNNWAVSGAKSSSGKALMAGDPHLHLTLPAIWFQLSMDSPGYHTSGVGIPGTPGVLIGHNEHISWSLTAAENQQTFYYIEHEEATHPGEYLWNGLWRKYKAVTYDIPVQGGPTEHLTVKLSVHGPVITERGQTTSVWWAGNIPSQDLDVLMGINQAADYQAFRNALKGWYSPTHNFVYADDIGNIGLISAGYYPQVAAGQPWLPMAGTGENDVIGTIPFDYIPQVYNPPSGFIWSANQRQVTSDYPYYIGTALNFATGYRSNEIFRVLSKGVNQGGKLSAADMMALQTDTRDFLAAEITPILLQALAGSQALRDQQAAQLLATWDYRMETDSAAATIWWTFWQEYIAQSFEPWWKAKKVSVDRAELNDALGQYLEALALAGKTVCTPPNCTSPAASACPTSACERLSLTLALRSAFGATTAKLTRQLGADPKKWTWGKVHQRVVENLAVRSLTYGPRPDRGDANTPLAAPDFPSSHGPSWRMVVDWGAGTFQGVYPGGQSENPASQWYADRIDAWWNGKYTAMLTAEQAASSKGSKVWRLRP